MSMVVNVDIARNINVEPTAGTTRGAAFLRRSILLRDGDISDFIWELLVRGS
jgi:hypothetical protein